MILVQLAGIIALEGTMYFRMVECTANGSEIDPSEMWSGLWMALLRYTLAGLPIILSVAWFGNQLGSIEIGFL